MGGRGGGAGRGAQQTYEEKQGKDEKYEYDEENIHCVVVFALKFRGSVARINNVVTGGFVACRRRQRV